MSVLPDSFSVLINHWPLIAGILLILVLGQILVWSVLQRIFGEELTSVEYYSLSLSGWMLPVFLASVVWLFWKSFQTQAFSPLIVFILFAFLALFLFLRTRKKSLRDSNVSLLILPGLFGIISFLRLAFVAKAVIPQYFDSAQHYLIIKNLLGNPTSSANAWLPTVYYHTGYHMVAAFLISILRTDLISTMLVLGQVILAVIPLSVFFLVRHETRSSRAGIFAVLLAAFGWYMPAHAVDWGKYPALASLALITFVASLAYIAIPYKKRSSSGNYLRLMGILLAAMVISVFTHSRSLVIFGMVIVAWLAATGWQKLPRLAQWSLLGFLLLGIIAELIFIQTKDVFGPLFDPYINKGLLITGIVLFLSIFAQWTYPKLSFSILFVICLLLGSLFVPVKGIPGYIDLTLLDRPFVEMIFYLPFSLLGGLGLAGLEQQVRTIPAKLGHANFWWSTSIVILFMGVVLINALFRYEVYPSGCCNIVSRDDLVAIDWIDKHLPANARILTSSTELRVLATEAFQGSVGGDAGTWITPLTSRTTIFYPSSSDLSQPATFESLCQMNVNYIYIGDTGVTFDNTQIAPHPDWYQVLLSMPKVKVYQIIGCK